MLLVYCGTDGEIFRTVDSVYKEDDTLWGMVGNGKVGYHMNCNPQTVEMTEELKKLYKPSKYQRYINGTIETIE